MKKILEEIIGAKKIAIAGHVRPDGDCIGSCTALYQYLRNDQKQLGIETVDMYLQPFGNEFRVLTAVDAVKHSCESDETYDLFISLDCGSLDRLGNAVKYFNSAGKTINIDHHISNTKFADVNHVVADASSTSEVIFTLMEEKRITKEIASSLYVGIIHDTGVFKHSNTTETTMNIAGKLIRKGIAFSELIQDTFYAKTYMQNQILGRCLMESILVLDGKVIVSSISRKMMEFYQASSSDLEGIVDQLRITKGVETAIFIYETEPNEFKVSMRSNSKVDVSKIAVYFGGGGHIRAAGCTMYGVLTDVINNLTPHIETQLKEG
ncbi:MAG: bifunctional oligoribonuclease/PAP phosphatase NrnA [Lachnospiraceae bacterium]|jgi:phosphoesterase RecJ-like protein|nr:bifunctional oligoribonuclease/PAP phosphatase NrnA [Lachnospiraceae bacterium]